MTKFFKRAYMIIGGVVFAALFHLFMLWRDAYDIVAEICQGSYDECGWWPW